MIRQQTPHNVTVTMQQKTAWLVVEDEPRAQVRSKIKNIILVINKCPSPYLTIINPTPVIEDREGPSSRRPVSPGQHLG